MHNDERLALKALRAHYAEFDEAKATLAIAEIGVLGGKAHSHRAGW